MRYFEAIDRLPPEQRQIRAVAAAFMQGRVQQRLGEMAPARAAFQAARRYAEAGAPDPMGLAVASLGEEARTDLVEAGLVTAPWPVQASDVDDAKIARLIADAVLLYAEQAARGSKMALLSLREVAERLVASDRELTLASADPLVRRLLVAYAVSRDYSWDNGLVPEIARVIDAVASQPGAGSADDLDRLAALAYLGGRYELAERLTAETNRPLGLWVRVKLALRRGDRAAAARDWTAALKGTEQAGTATTLDGKTKARLRGEVAVMRLSQGEYSDSLRLLFPVASIYWGDVIYIAERVLTVDELKAFVDGLPPPRPVTPTAIDPQDVLWPARLYDVAYIPSPDIVPADRLVLTRRSPDFVPAERLRLVLARRLVRDGRVAEAVAYFPTPAPKTTAEQGDGGKVPEDGARPRPLPYASAEEARNYLAAIEATRPGRPAASRWQKLAKRVTRAEALFKVATLDRRRGMELMGTEGPPDEAVMGGAFASGVGQSSPEGLDSELLGPDEARRFAASAPRPDIRFHYRVVAADRASAAADLLPQRSQAYAATLCWAARYAIHSGDQDKADAIYRRYVANGAYQAWARDFGQICPAPDFEGARTFWRRPTASWPTQIARSVWRHIKDALAALRGYITEENELPLTGIPAQAQQSQAGTWCYASDTDGVSLDLRISGCSTSILSGTLSNSNLALAYYNRGIAYSTKDQLDLAIQDYDQAIKLDPSNADVFYRRSLARAKKGDKKGADADHAAARRTGIPAQAQQSQAGMQARTSMQASTWCYASEEDGVSLELKISGCSTEILSGTLSNSDLALAYNNRGFAYSTKGQLDRAIQDYDQAIKLDPGDAVVYNNRGFAYSTKGQLDRAIQDYDQAIKLDPSDAIVYYNRGIAYSAKGQLDRAIQDYDQAIKLDPSDADVFYGRSVVRAKKGDKKGADADLAAARRTGIPAPAQQPQAWMQAQTWCYASEADGVPPELRISRCSTLILSGTLSNSDLALGNRK